MKKLLTLLLAVAVYYFAQRQGWVLPDDTSASGGATATESRSDSAAPAPKQGAPAGDATQESADDGAETIRQAFHDERSGFMVESHGVVEKILPDDNEGSRHQKFILRLDNRHTVLMAHNIDLAPRVPVDEGDAVSFKGQYEWNERGGVVHWTHKDPGGYHEEGWIEAAGKRYE